MGHTRLGELEATLPWRRVIGLITSGADVAAIAAATSEAAEHSLFLAGRDPVPRHVFYLLAQVPLAARADNFPTSLRPLGILLHGPVTLASLCGGFVEAVDRLALPAKHRSDLGEIATLSAVESLSAIVGRETTDLFEGTDSEAEVGAALGRLATPKHFGILAHDFFARLTRRHLDYYLSRELPKHVGLTERFHSVREHIAFEEALDLHCREAAEITREFSGGWFSRGVYERTLDPASAGAAIEFAFEKIRSELQVRRQVHA
jgi:hypothetical protein